jgi:hypothetical protein
MTADNRAFWTRVLAALAFSPAAWAMTGGAGQPAAPTDHARASDLARAAERGALCSSVNAIAAGLQAEYFAEENFRGALLASRLEGPLDGGPVAFVGGDGGARVARSIRWRGWLKPPFAGAYAFHIEPAGATVRVAGILLAGAGSKQRQLELAPGRYYPVLVEMASVRALPKAGSVRLRWTAPHGANYTVPRALLYPPSDSLVNGR